MKPIATIAAGLGLVALLAWVGLRPRGAEEAGTPPSTARDSAPLTALGTTSGAKPKAPPTAPTPAEPTGSEQRETAPDQDRDVLERATGHPARLPDINTKTDTNTKARPAGNRITTLFERSPVSGANRSRQIAASLAALRSSSAGINSGASLTPEELAAAYRQLAADTPEGLRDPEWHWLADELMSTLRAAGGDPDGLAHQLASISRDSSADPVIRDYALQHLGHLHGEGGDTNTIEAALFSATAEKSGTLAGVALLALHRASSQEGLSTDINLGEGAYAVANNPDTDLRSRLTALQVAGKQGHAESLPLAASIAADESQPVPLRMSAIATIADLGARGQLPLITNLSTSRDPRLRGAAAAALARLSSN